MTPQPPVAKTVPYTFTHLGQTFEDPYTWLQNKQDPEVITYLEAENAYAKATLAHTAALQETLFQEMKGRLAEDDASVPEPRGEYLYYWRLEAGKQYRIFCRKHGSLDAPEEILLDENALAEGKTYCRVAIFQPSPDNRRLAYAVDFTGSWEFDIYILDLQTMQTLSGPLPKAAYTLAWASDNETLFYTRFDTSHRPYQLVRHTTGTPTQADVVVFHEPDEKFNLIIHRARSGQYLFLTARSHTTSDVRWLPANQPQGEFTLLAERRPWREYYMEHHSDVFLVRSNHTGVNFAVYTAPITNPGEENWHEILPHREDTLLEAVEPFQDALVILEQREGLHHMRISAPNGVDYVRYIQMPEPVYDAELDANPEFSSPTVRLVYNSLVTPLSVVEVDFESMAWNVRKVQPIPSGYDASQYTSERQFALAPDGVRVPISLVRRKDTPLDGSAPLLLYGYGSYGYSTEANFNSNRLSLLDRGFIYAIGHIRGGSEMGRAWYENGRLMHKMNTFTDFIACAEHLVRQGCTRPEKLAIMGGSAGGLLVSAVANLRPDLFKAVVALVPFTNVITAMLLPDLPLTVTEWEQWGNPAKPEEFAYMLTYSPYENVVAQAYPHIYIRAGLNDLQVPYWDPAKWAARLRALKTDTNPLRLVTIMGAGHGGSSGRYNTLRETAETYAFLLDTLENINV